MSRFKFDKKTMIIIAVVLIGGFFIVSNNFASQGGDQPTDVTLSNAPTDQTPVAKATGTVPTPDAQATPVELTADQLASKPGAIVLLNPAAGTRGSNIGISGVGFDPGQTIDVFVQLKENDKPQNLGFAQVDQGGGFGGVGFKIPDDVTVDTFTISVQQHDGKKKASAKGRITGSSTSIKMGTQVGKAGNQIAVSGKGFAPNEKVLVYFNSLSSDPVTTLTADGSGGIGRASVKVPFGPAGDNQFIFVGETSQSPVTVPFLMLTYYPSATISEYAAKADTPLTFSGKDFGPGERVLIYLNSMSTPPVAVIQADDQGNFSNAGGFVIPFELTGKNLLIFFGEMTQSSVTTGFDVLPYTPNAEPSTYGGQPGTSLTFYGAGFARNEIVRVYTGRTQGSSGKQVACFTTDDQGSVVGGSVSYTVPGNAQAGKMSFTLIGDKSKSQATATIQVMPASGPVQSDIGGTDQAPFSCPYDAAPPQPQPTQQSQQAQPTKSPQAQPTQQAQPTKSPQAQPTQQPQQAQPTKTPQPQPTQQSQQAQPTKTPQGQPTQPPQPTPQH